MKVEDVS
jgi:hypothetical protein